MEQSKVKLVLRITKAVLLIVLLVFFYFYFFLDVFTKFKSRRTNMATREELFRKNGINGIQSPAITVCLSPNLKPSVLKKYNMTYLSSFHSREVLQKHNVTFSRLVQEASYRLNEDFEIKMGDRYLVNQYSLKLGRNKIKYDKENEIEVMVQEIPSPMFGFCLLIIPDTLLSVDKYYPVSITLNNSEMLKNSHNPMANLYLTSKYDYLGVVSGIWKNLNPCRVDINFAQGTTLIDVKQTRQTMVECDEYSPYHSFHDCFAKLIQPLIINNNCSNRCSGIHFQAYEVYLDVKLFEDECTLKEEECLLGPNGITKEMLNLVDQCPLQCNLTQFTATLTHSGNINMDGHGTNSADFILLSGSNAITINEEYWVYDNAGLIGAIGGSLGLFAGFSFYDCICMILDWIYSKTFENRI